MGLLFKEREKKIHLPLISSLIEKHWRASHAIRKCNGSSSFDPFVIITERMQKKNRMGGGIYSSFIWRWELAKLLLLLLRPSQSLISYFFLLTSWRFPRVSRRAFFLLLLLVFFDQFPHSFGSAAAQWRSRSVASFLFSRPKKTVENFAD